MKNYTKYTAIVSTILLTSALAGPANAETPTTASLENAPTDTSQFAAVSADPTIHLKEAEPDVITTPAPILPTVSYVGPQSNPVVVKASATASAAPRAASAPAPAAKSAAPAPAAPVGVGRGAALLASAYAQIGMTQDCTAMVERALGSIGIITGDIAPNDFFRFGTATGNPLPGDIMISAGHVGIYAGNGQMISGGFNGNQTVLHPVKYVGAASYVRVA